MEPARKLHPGIIALIVIVLIGIAATAVIVIHNNSNKSAGSTTTTQTAITAADTAPSTTYKDGTYNATGSYVSPEGKESIELTVTLKDGIITSTSLVGDATGGNAKDYQAQFASGYKDLVVGRNIDRVALSRVAGSSLTSNGFKDALDQIKTNAKA
ncbi:MAG: hypothetical protein JWN12_267 [Candidatus Saccharibacteria bacterium]|nr:hypothetical protein [Candidatus Saccharibacteria bacterium]